MSHTCVYAYRVTMLCVACVHTCVVCRKCVYTCVVHELCCGVCVCPCVVCVCTKWKRNRVELRVAGPWGGQLGTSPILGTGAGAGVFPGLCLRAGGGWAVGGTRPGASPGRSSGSDGGALGLPLTTNPSCGAGRKCGRKQGVVVAAAQPAWPWAAAACPGCQRQPVGPASQEPGVAPRGLAILLPPTRPGAASGEWEAGTRGRWGRWDKDGLGRHGPWSWGLLRRVARKLAFHFHFLEDSSASWDGGEQS